MTVVRPAVAEQLHVAGVQPARVMLAADGCDVIQVITRRESAVTLTHAVLCRWCIWWSVTAEDEVVLGHHGSAPVLPGGVVATL